MLNSPSLRNKTICKKKPITSYTRFGYRKLTVEEIEYRRQNLKAQDDELERKKQQE
jgi:hypothetical protein